VLPLCTCVLQTTLVHLYQTSSFLPSPLPTVASASLRLLYSFLYSEHINQIQVLSFLPFPFPPMHVLPLVCDSCPIILLLILLIKNILVNILFLVFKSTFKGIDFQKTFKICNHKIYICLDSWG
jgi:hypothetical protein